MRTACARALVVGAAMRAPAPQMARLFEDKGRFFITAPFVGNAGIDPFNIATPEHLVALRHAEVKHGRLAMIAAIAWPAQELVHPALAKMVGVDDLLASTHGLSPSLIAGGLDAPECAPA